MIDHIIKTKQMPRPEADFSLCSQKPSGDHAEKKCRDGALEEQRIWTANNIKGMVRHRGMVDSGRVVNP